MNCSVLTGDIVNSSALSAKALDGSLEAIQHAAIDISGWESVPGQGRGKIVIGFARRGGDGWQIALSEPRFGLRAALFVVAHLRLIDKSRATRIAIATGSGTLPPDRDPNFAHGPAFTASGRLLSDLSGHARMGHASGGAVQAATRLADHIAQGWTPAQARAVAGALAPSAPTRAEIAEGLGITRQAVDQALWAAGYPALSDALGAIEHAALSK